MFLLQEKKQNEEEKQMKTNILNGVCIELKCFWEANIYCIPTKLNIHLIVFFIQQRYVENLYVGAILWDLGEQLWI